MQEESAMDGSVRTFSVEVQHFIKLYENGDNHTFVFQDPLEKKNESCRSLFGRLNDSLLVWGNKLPIEAR
jgi:hypothetical protein